MTLVEIMGWPESIYCEIYRSYVIKNVTLSIKTRTHLRTLKKKRNNQI